MSDTQHQAEESREHGEMTLVEHLMELRFRLVRIVISVVVVLIFLMPFANQVYAILAGPLLAHMPDGATMIATQVASPFLAPFKLSLVLAVFLTIPFALYHFWAFIAPGLYRQEKRLVFPLLCSSVGLFYGGIAFAYFVVFPLMFSFFQAVAPEGVAIMTDISTYLDFTLKIFFAFGLVFEVPIVTFVLVWTGFITARAMAAKRPYIIVGAFVFGMLLTPPDMLSQTLLAVPMWLLFELGLILSRIYVPRKKASLAEGTENVSVS